MALIGIALQLRPKHRAIQNPSFIYFFSSSTSDSNVGDQNTLSSSQSQFQSQSSLYSYFSDVRASLKQQQSPQQKYRQQPSKCSLSSPKPPQRSLLWKISARTAPGSAAAPPCRRRRTSRRRHLRLFRRLSPSRFRSFASEMCEYRRQVCHSRELEAAPIAGKKSERTSPSSAAAPLPFRPRVDGIMTFKDLRESLIKLKFPDYEKTEKQTSSEAQCLSGQFGGTPNFMLAPLKDQLVEKYCHPDNILSSEKPKHELQKVRDEFKMSESDCESARVRGNTF
ncbi:unnamed protein product [Camellia sinensis]